MNLKDQLKKYLELRGMTAAELSRRSGVSKQVLSVWLAGAAPKNLAQVKLVSEVLRVSVDHLCFGSGISDENESNNALEALLDGDSWLGGAFEIKIRRLKRNKNV